MNLLIKDRGKGKTTGLIYTSEATQYPIVTFNIHSIDDIKAQAEQMGCLIPEPLCLRDFKVETSRGKKLPENILLDDVGFILRDALNAYLGTNVVTATMSDSLKKDYKVMNFKSMKNKAWLLDDDILLRGIVKRKYIFRHIFIPNDFGCGFSYQYVSKHDIGKTLFYDDVHFVYSGYGHLKRVY